MRIRPPPSFGSLQPHKLPFSCARKMHDMKKRRYCTLYRACEEIPERGTEASEIGRAFFFLASSLVLSSFFPSPRERAVSALVFVTAFFFSLAFRCRCDTENTSRESD